MRVCAERDPTSDAEPAVEIQVRAELPLVERVNRHVRTGDERLHDREVRDVHGGVRLASGILPKHGIEPDEHVPGGAVRGQKCPRQRVVRERAPSARRAVWPKVEALVVEAIPDVGNVAVPFAVALAIPSGRQRAERVREHETTFDEVVARAHET
jgi:hypothetical protein